jgi:ABC-type phosphate/phosphonate transport system substrate-binding protein
VILDRKKIVRRLSLINLLALLLVISATERASAQGKLVVAIQPSVSSDDMLKKARPLEKFLRDGLDGKTDVQVYVPSTFAAVVESLRFGHAQIAFMSAWPAQLAVQLGGAGGLGFVMQVYLQTLEYRRLASVLLLILVVVLAMDGLSAWVRKRFLLTAQ